MQKDLQRRLQAKYGQKKGQALTEKYIDSLPDFTLDQIEQDIEFIEKLSAKNPLELYLYYSKDNEQDPTVETQSLHLRLYQWGRPLPLSDVLPMLENMDLRTFDERPQRLILPGSLVVWISDFSISYKNNTFLDLKKIEEVFRTAFKNIYLGIAENDGFNRLVLNVLLSWREVNVFRTYAKYLRQTGIRFSQSYIEHTLNKHAAITAQLAQLFQVHFDPKKKTNRDQRATAIERNILQDIDKVTSLDEDRILRHYLNLIKGTLRTNYFQTTKIGEPKNYLALKLNSRVLLDLPLPVPLYEIFVYSQRFEAIHLRNTKVARGGIRWSDRREDFRTEILGLMKAQVEKNAVIVPSGAKGGFVLKKLAEDMGYDVIQKEVIDCYQTFMQGLLDLTDNIVKNKIIHPAETVCYDDDDPYLVVAADKGTATFSDLANQIAAQYDFWLGDAFASGGSHGYDHKAMGITARGAWESVKRHFLDLNMDVRNTIISVIGIGDMSGDVFGNGMIYSANIKLLAAFDNRNIFLDPDPNPKVSFNERLRMFRLPRSSWEEYNPKLISKGGGVYKRSLKSIPLSAEIKKALSIDEDSLTPNDLVKAILKAPVDLFWNGGIGTFVKASSENNEEVGDRTNDFCRVNGDELRCKVVGEGGNLGFTQLGRVEYALKGGLIFTDFIDNSAGVDCSDHEVNLKILLDQEVKKGKLTENKRNQILVSVTNEVADLVLNDNYQQALVMGYSTFHAKKRMGLHQSYIKELVALGELNRLIEFLPDEKKIIERKSAGVGLTSPEIAVLLEYTKIHIKNEILKSTLPEESYFSQIVSDAFPASLQKEFGAAMKTHRLKREIIATQLSNSIVNEMGITFFYRLELETSANIAEIVRAQTIASRIFDASKLLALIESLNFKIAVEVQYDLIFQMHSLITLVTRWFLRCRHREKSIEEVIAKYQPRLSTLEPMIPSLMVGITKNYLDTLSARFIEIGLKKELANHFAVQRAMYTTLNAIEIADIYKFDLIKTVKMYFAVGERFNLVWFRDQLALDTREGHWNALARATLRDDLDVIQRTLTATILSENKKEMQVTKLIEGWLARYPRVLGRWEKIQALVQESGNIDYTLFFIVLKEFLNLTSCPFPEVNG